MAGIVIDFGVVVACWNYCVHRVWIFFFSFSTQVLAGRDRGNGDSCWESGGGKFVPLQHSAYFVRQLRLMLVDVKERVGLFFLEGRRERLFVKKIARKFEVINR